MSKESRMRHAKQLLEDPLMVEIMEAQRSDAIAMWLATPANDQNQRDMCWMLIKAQEAFKTRLQAVIDDGLIAANQGSEQPVT